jgi:hypothetical protein
MTINNIKSYVDNLWDWGILNGCFGNTNIKPTDIDGIVERNGEFLLLEAKSPHKEIPRGQQIMFNNLMKTGIFTIMVIWGNVNKPEEIQITNKLGIGEKEPCDLAKFRESVVRWFSYANK